ncbi:MAG: hypothetical protein H0V66_00050 [Bdellovibrionales bacterium]|nr:hypothetical protein [Bdellovibrionales bacterium]
MKFLWLLLILTFSNQVFSADADAISINPTKLLVINPVASDIVLTDIEKRMINKIMLKACAKQIDYQIALGEIGLAREALMNISQVSLTLNGNEQNLKVTALLLDEKNKIMINKIVKERIERLHLMRTVEEVVEALFKKTVQL